MIDRFNFFDVYGYLIPGLVLTLVLGLPHAIIRPSILSIDLGSGVALIVVAYVLGQQLYGLAELTIVSKMWVKEKEKKRLRHFSEFILYDHDPTNSFGSNAAREALRTSIDKYFAAPVAANAATAPPATEPHRHFLSCRAALLQKKRASYAEQYQGMYVLARSAAAACALGICHLLGWISILVPVHGRVPRLLLVALSMSVALAGAGLLARAKHWTSLESISPRLRRVLRVGDDTFTTAKETLERRTAWLVLAALGVFLFVAGRQTADPAAVERLRGVFLSGLFVSSLIGLRSYAAFRHFALEFAKAVYRDFRVLALEESRAPKKGEAND